jgi:tetratricopeptide (TPR) repeat protein
MAVKFVEKGLKLYTKQKWQEAEEEFVKAVEANDIATKGWYYLGLCRENLEDFEGAQFCFKKAMSAAKMMEPPDQITERLSLLELATIEIKTEQYIAAMGYLRKINQLQFKDNSFRSTVWGVLGEIYEKLNKKEYALFCYQQSQKNGNKKYRKQVSTLEEGGTRPDDPDDKNSPNLLKRKADILFGQQKFTDAIKVYQETLRTNNQKKVLSEADHAETTMKIAYAYINVQDFPNAKTYLLEAKKLYTNAKMMDEIKVIDSTLNKINSLIST